MKKANLKILYICIIFFICAGFVTGCGDRALFDELETNRVKVVIKGTYESNDPRPWTGTFLPYDSSYNGTVIDPNPSLFMMDIAGLRLYAESGRHKQDFANYRKTFSSALNDSDPFFNGTGILYKNDDMRPDFQWEWVGVFIRKMLFDGAVDYSPTGVRAWGNSQNVQDLFQEETVNGFNFNMAQVLSYYDYLKMNYLEVNRVFPLVIPFEDGFVFDYNNKEVVMEIRLVIKNFVKKYEYEYIDADNNRKLRHFFSFSDWLRDIKKNEPAPTSDTMGIMGGNVLAVARYYVPGKVATITGNITGNNRYVIAVKAGHSYAEYQLVDPVTDRIRPTCDSPKIPRSPILPAGGNTSEYIEDLLQYYLQYETYKQNFDAYVTCVDNGTYSAVWDDYNNGLSTFKIPPIATYVASGKYTFTNVPVGATYTIYQSESGVAAGDLPTDYSSLLGTITLTEADAGQSIDLP